MKTVTVAIADLSGKQLDYAVAQALNGRKESIPGLKWGDGIFAKVKAGEYRPTTDWAQGGPLIDRFNIDINTQGIDETGRTVQAYSVNTINLELTCAGGDGVLEAVCRVVVLRLSDYEHVIIPEGLDG